ncbi:hypothetical protein AB16_4223 [Escherichia coli 3-073-06_S1_C1]|nr:hypothetical protein AB16_4223 [Escherichia coli 3-073-06_S1_C1]
MTIQAVTELDNKADHCHLPVLNGIVHVRDPPIIAIYTTF